jgi:hypothetical protein
MVSIERASKGKAVFSPDMISSEYSQGFLRGSFSSVAGAAAFWGVPF